MSVLSILFEKVHRCYICVHCFFFFIDEREEEEEQKRRRTERAEGGGERTRSKRGGNPEPLTALAGKDKRNLRPPFGEIDWENYRAIDHHNLTVYVAKASVTLK